MLEKYAQREVEYALKLLNNMSISRREKIDNNFETIGSILLTANSKILRIANDENIKEQGNVPLATSIDFLTNKFWFKLNKGFGTSDYPKAFSIFTKAQIVLASHINDNLNNQLNKIKEKIKNNILTEDDVLKNLAVLKTSVKKPEDITQESIDEIYLLLNDNSVEEIVGQHKSLKAEVVENRNHIDTLQKKISASELNMIEINNNLEKSKKDAEVSRQKNFDTISKWKKSLDEEVERRLSGFKKKLLYSTVGYYLALIALKYMANLNHWNILTIVESIVVVAPPLSFILYRIISEKEFSYRSFIKNKREKIRKKVYSENDFNESNLY